MKVLFIGNQSSSIILFRKNVIEYLSRNGVEVYTLTMDADISNFENIRKMGAIPQHFKFSRSGVNPFSDLKNTLCLAGKIKKISPDVVLCFFPKPVIYGTLAAKLAGVKKNYALLEGLGFCYTKHSVKDSLRKKILKKIQTLLYKISLPLATKVLFLNNDDYIDLVVKNSINVQGYAVIGGVGVNLDYYNPQLPELTNIHFGMVARLLKEKGVREFVDAARIVKKIYPEINFSIAGAVDDNPGGLGRQQISDWESENIVEFLGQLSDIKSYLGSLSVFVLPSYREGVPKSTQEAMSMGRAIITTDVPGCRETVVNGYNGYLIPPWDVNQLVVSMVSFIENPNLIISMGENSRKLAESKFDENRATDSLVNIILSK